MAEKSLLGTMTGETFQPVRLHYKVFNKKALLQVFKKLQCVDRDPDRPRWVWLYDGEAKNLPFKLSYDQIPANYRPLVIGSLYLRNDKELLLDLRSCERAILAIPFFDRYIPRKVAKVAEAELVNRLYSLDEAQVTPEAIFDRQQSTKLDPEAFKREVIEATSHLKDPNERVRLAEELMEAKAKEPLPEIERFPVHYNEDGIRGFTMILQMRQILAIQHWQGNTGFSLFDVFKKMMM